MGTRGVRARAREARRGVNRCEKLLPHVDSPAVSVRGANGEVETRRTWRVHCSFSRWSGKTDHFSWVANRQMQQRSIVERVGLRAASGNGGDELACDVCQMNPVYVMCYEDRAFLCRSCDVNIHSANGSAAKHQRFLFTNTRVELESLGAGEEVGRRTSPTDSAADHMVPQFEQEEVGRKVRFFSRRTANLPQMHMFKEHQN